MWSRSHPEPEKKIFFENISVCLSVRNIFKWHRNFQKKLPSWAAQQIEGWRRVQMEQPLCPGWLGHFIPEFCFFNCMLSVMIRAPRLKFNFCELNSSEPMEWYGTLGWSDF